MSIYFHLPLILVIQIIHANLSPPVDFFGSCNILEGNNDWIKNTDGSVIKSWLRSLTPASKKYNVGNVIFRNDYSSIIPISVRNKDGFMWKIFGNTNHDGYAYYRTRNPMINPELLYYIFPDFKTALYGFFPNGIMKKAWEVEVTHYKCSDGVMILKFSDLKYDVVYSFDTPSRIAPSTTPLNRDPFERKLVYVQNSKEVKNARTTDGLFAKKDIPVHSIVAYYNGFMIPLTEYEGLIKNITDTIELEDYQKNILLFNETHVLDIPPKFTCLTKYRETLAHKAMHSFSRANAKFSDGFHPKFGRVKLLKSIVPIKRGDEILVDYGYQYDISPQWYKDLITRHFGISENKN